MSTPEIDDTQTPDSSEKQQVVDFEKRYKDTQAVYTKSQQELKAVKAKLEVLEKLTTPQIQLDAATQQELDDLMYTDPQAWRARMNAIESEATNKHKALLDETEKQVLAQTELENRARLLSEYNRSHPNFPITDEVIEFDVPARITKKLEKGDITFEDYLQEVHSFLYSPKKVGTGNETLNQPNLGKISGGDTPSEGAIMKDIVANYKNIIY